VPADEWFAIDVHSSAEAAHPVAAARSVKVASPSDLPTFVIVQTDR
jgi:hypothetical protein